MLATIERLKKTLELDDELLEISLLAASNAIEDYCKRTFRKQEYTEKISGATSSKYINLRNYPVHKIVKLDISGYEILGEEGRLYHPSGWPEGEHNIEVKYIGGYVLPGDATQDEPRTLPPSLEMACLLYAQVMARTPDVVSERVGDISVTYDKGEGLPASVMALISPYVGRWV